MDEKQNKSTHKETDARQHVRRSRPDSGDKMNPIGRKAQMKFSTDVLLSSDQWVPSQLKMIYPPPWVRPQMGTRHPHPILGADLTPAGAICGMDQTPLGVILSVYG